MKIRRRARFSARWVGAWMIGLLWLGCAPQAVCGQAARSDGGYQQALDRGLAAFQNQAYASARASFARAHALRPNARTLRALGLTDFALDRYELAHRELSAALVEPTAPLTSEQRREVEELLAWIRTSLGRLRLELRPPDARAAIDDRPVDTRAPELWVELGEHRLRVSVEGQPTHQQRFVLQRSPEPLVLRVDLATSAAVGGSSIWWWVGGGGVALIAAGAVTFGIGLHYVAKVEGRAPPETVSADEVASERSTSRWLTGVGLGLGGLGVAALTTAVVLWLQRDRGPSERAWSYSVTGSGVSVRRMF